MRRERRLSLSRREWRSSFGEGRRASTSRYTCSIAYIEIYQVAKVDLPSRCSLGYFEKEKTRYFPFLSQLEKSSNYNLKLHICITGKRNDRLRLLPHTTIARCLRFDDGDVIWTGFFHFSDSRVPDGLLQELGTLYERDLESLAARWWRRAVID